jgi:hypothetical protein
MTMKYLVTTALLGMLGLCSQASLQAANITEVSYNLYLGNGTLNGNPVTNLLIFESGEGMVSLDFGFTIPGSGSTLLTHTVPFQPSTSLIVGLDLPSTTGGDNKTHVLFFTNDAFAQGANGVLFSLAFPTSRHNNFISRLLLAEAGDAAEQAWLTNFFLTGDGAAAAFAYGTQATAIEFTGGVIIGRVPEPQSGALMGAGVLGLLLVGRRRMRQR